MRHHKAGQLEPAWTWHMLLVQCRLGRPLECWHHVCGVATLSSVVFCGCYLLWWLSCLQLCFRSSVAAGGVHCNKGETWGSWGSKLPRCILPGTQASRHACTGPRKCCNALAVVSLPGTLCAAVHRRVSRVQLYNMWYNMVRMCAHLHSSCKLNYQSWTAEAADSQPAGNRLSCATVCASPCWPTA